MDLIRAIRLLALKSVLKPDFDDHVRQVQRWYSKTFHTPLADVENLALEDLLRVYYEEKYAESKEEDLEAERQELILSEDEAAILERERDAEEADAIAYAQIVEAEEREAELKARENKDQKITATGETQGPVVPGTLGTGKTIRDEGSLPVPEKLPPDITMQFVDPDKFDEELEGFGTMAAPDRGNLPK